MTYKHPLAVMARRLRYRPWSMTFFARERTRRLVRIWTASHVPIAGLPVEVVRAMAVARRAQAAAVQFVATYAPRLAEEMRGRARRAVTAQLATRPIRCGECEHHRVKSYGDRDPPHSECRHPSRNNRLVVVDEDHAPPRGCPLPKAPKKRGAP